MAAAARPLPQADDTVSRGVTRAPLSCFVHQNDHRELHQGTLAREKIPTQGADKRNDVQETRLETILTAIAAVHNSVDERLALARHAIDQVSDIEQVKEAVSEKVRDIV